MPVINAKKPILFAAMEMEAKAVQRAVTAHDLRVTALGIRAIRFRGELIDPNASCVILAGLGGALDPSLKIGDVVVEQNAGLALPAGIRSGAIHTVDQMITTVAEKSVLFKSTGAMVVDMENQIVRKAAEKIGVPFIGIRAVSDTADQAIDPEVFSLADEMGRPKLAAAMALLMRRPSLMGQLRRLNADSQTALRALAKAVKELVERL